MPISLGIRAHFIGHPEIFRKKVAGYAQRTFFVTTVQLLGKTVQKEISEDKKINLFCCPIRCVARLKIHLWLISRCQVSCTFPSTQISALVYLQYFENIGKIYEKRTPRGILFKVSLMGSLPSEVNTTYCAGMRMNWVHIT